MTNAKLSADIAEECGPLLYLDLPAVYGPKVDMARKPRRGHSGEIRRWWIGEFRSRFEGTAISGPADAAKFAKLVEYLGRPEDVQRYLECVLERWDEMQRAWGLDGKPTPGFLLGWKHRVLQTMRTGEVPAIRNRETEEASGEQIEWT